MMLIVMGMMPILVMLRGNSTAFPACMKATHRMKRPSFRRIHDDDVYYYILAKD